MLYLVCPTCKNILGNKQIPFKEELKKISESTQSINEQNKKKEEVLDKLGLDKYCCRMRITTYTEDIEIVK